MANMAAVRRRRKYRKIMSDYGNYMIAGVVAVAVIVIVSVLAAVFSAKGQQAEAESTETAEPEEVRVIIVEADKAAGEEASIDDTYPFNIMSRDWDGEDLVGFKAYQIPQELEEDGGCFPDVMQKYTYIVCNQAGVDYATILAVIETESGYIWDAVGSGGDIGYMQIVQKWHEDRMEKLNAGNMLDLFQNIRVGVDYLAELLDKYNGSYEKALTAYQYGPSGAYKYWFSAGVDASPYAKEVLAKAARIEEEMEVQADVGE